MYHATYTFNLIRKACRAITFSSSFFRRWKHISSEEVPFAYTWWPKSLFFNKQSRLRVVQIARSKVFAWYANATFAFIFLKASNTSPSAWLIFASMIFPSFAARSLKNYVITSTNFRAWLNCNQVHLSVWAFCLPHEEASFIFCTCTYSIVCSTRIVIIFKSTCKKRIECWPLRKSCAY